VPEWLAAVPASAPLGRLPSASELAACSHNLVSRHQLQQYWLGEISASTELPVCALPHLPRGISCASDLHALGDALLGSPP
jgi:hypothetical protein